MIEVKVLNNPVIDLSIIPNEVIDISFAEHQGVPYVGDYSVTPKVHSETVLFTGGKELSDNVTVFKIPQYETTNPQGGYTLIIGDDTL